MMAQVSSIKWWRDISKDLYDIWKVLLMKGRGVQASSWEFLVYRWYSTLATHHNNLESLPKNPMPRPNPRSTESEFLEVVPGPLLGFKSCTGKPMGSENPCLNSKFYPVSQDLCFLKSPGGTSINTSLQHLLGNPGVRRISDFWIFLKTQCLCVCGN